MNAAAQRTVLAILVLSLSAGHAAADPPGLTTLPIGAAAPDFRLAGRRWQDLHPEGLRRRQGPGRGLHLQPLPDRPGLRGADRPAARRLSRTRACAVVAISPNDPAAVRLDELGYTDLGDSFEDMKIRAKDHKFTFPYLYDGETQATAKAYGVLATPHVYIFDAARKLRYVGRFDDAEVKTVKSHDARNAIEALLAGKPVPVEKTRVFGCSTKWAEKQADARKSLAKWDAEPVTLEPIDDGRRRQARRRTTPRSCG